MLKVLVKVKKDCRFLSDMVHTAEEGKPKCKKCGSGHIDLVKEEGKKYLVCLDCGFEFPA